MECFVDLPSLVPLPTSYVVRSTPYNVQCTDSDSTRLIMIITAGSFRTRI